MRGNDEGVPNTATISKIAERVRDRREELDLDQDLARYGGPSRSTVSTLENAGRWPLRQRTRNSWATALGWEPDAFERMARGEEPRELIQEFDEGEVDPLRAWLRTEIERVVRVTTQDLREEVERLEHIVQVRRDSASPPGRSSGSPDRPTRSTRRGPK